MWFILLGSKFFYLFSVFEKLAQLEEFTITRGIFTKPKKATVKELKSLISQWVDDHGPNEKLQTLEVDICLKASTAVCVHENILFVADAGIGKVLQLLVEECNLKLKAKASSLFTLPNGTSSIPTSLCYDANQLWLAHFSDNGGICSFQFSESVLQSKVKNGSQKCKRVYGVAPLPQSRIVFSDINNFQHKSIDQDGIVSVIAGSGESCRRYRVGTRAAFGQPSAVCTEIETMFVADPAVSSVCMISSPAPLVTYLQKMGELYDVFSIHTKKQYSLEEG